MRSLSGGSSGEATNGRAGGAPRVDTALHQRHRPGGDLREIGRRQRADRDIFGEDDDAAGAQHVRRQAVEARPDRPHRVLRVRLAVLGARPDHDRGRTVVEPMRRLGDPDAQHIRHRRGGGSPAPVSSGLPSNGRSSTTTSQPICISHCAVMIARVPSNRRPARGGRRGCRPSGRSPAPAGRPAPRPSPADGRRRYSSGVRTSSR